MLKDKLKKYDDPRDTHGFYENFNQPVDIANLFDVVLSIVVLVSIVVILFKAFF